jgi:tetratricopeptide (TPR) repeat protein
MTRPRALLLSSLLAFGLSSTACNDAGQTQIAAGNVLASSKRYDEAIKAYQSAAQAMPNKARPRELLGHVLFDLRRLPEARAAYADAVRVEPEGALEARIGLARLDAEDGHLDEAIATLTQVIKSDPNNLYAWLSRANLLIRRGAPDDAQGAINDSDKAAQLGAKNVSVIYTRGCARLAAKQFDQAEAMFQQIPAESPLGAYGQARVASAKSDKLGALSKLREARSRAAALPEGWRPDEVKSDPAFRALKEDPEFLAVVGS